jgi:hypothetical protein
LQPEEETVDGAVASDAELKLADNTGGRRILSTHGVDLTTGFNEVIEDPSGYNLLGDHATGDDSDPQSPNRHKVDVRVLRRGPPGQNTPLP